MFSYMIMSMLFGAWNCQKALPFLSLLLTFSKKYVTKYASILRLK